MWDIFPVVFKKTTALNSPKTQFLLKSNKIIKKNKRIANMFTKV